MRITFVSSGLAFAAGATGATGETVLSVEPDCEVGAVSTLEQLMEKMLDAAAMIRYFFMIIFFSFLLIWLFGYAPFEWLLDSMDCLLENNFVRHKETGNNKGE